MLLGVDVGTGGTRAVMIDRGGKVLASFASEHAPIRSEHIGWAEQEPEDWWRAAREAVDRGSVEFGLAGDLAGRGAHAHGGSIEGEGKEVKDVEGVEEV